MPDALFADPRLAVLYDPLDADRSDLDVYAAIVDELEATSVLDVGCGTGTFACMLAGRGLDVVGVDPAAASIELARSKPGADRVRWIVGDATRLPALAVDVATMTGNVAQVFVTDDDWSATVAGVHGALAPGGHFVFETRVPERRAWLEWNRDATFTRTDVAGVGLVEHWYDVVDVREDEGLVTFVATFVFETDGAVRTSESTLRFRSRGEAEASLVAAGFVVEDVRDAPGRPGREHVFIARR